MIRFAYHEETLQIFSFIQSVLVFVQAGNGFGRSVDEISGPDMISWQKVRSWTMTIVLTGSAC